MDAKRWKGIVEARYEEFWLGNFVFFVMVFDKSSGTDLAHVGLSDGIPNKGFFSDAKARSLWKYLRTTTKMCILIPSSLITWNGIIWLLP